MIKQGIICTVISAFHKLQFPRHPFLTDSTKKMWWFNLVTMQMHWCTYKTTVNLYTIYTLIYIDRCSVKYLYCSICVEWNGIETVIMFIWINAHTENLNQLKITNYVNFFFICFFSVLTGSSPHDSPRNMSPSQHSNFLFQNVRK